jgi:hypothetical protein
MYSNPPSRIDGRVLEPAHQSIPDLQIEADAMKTRAADLDGHVPRAESARNPSRRRKSAHHSSRQLRQQGPPASWQGKPYCNREGTAWKPLYFASCWVDAPRWGGRQRCWLAGPLSPLTTPGPLGPASCLWCRCRLPPPPPGVGVALLSESSVGQRGASAHTTQLLVPVTPVTLNYIDALNRASGVNRLGGILSERQLA